MIVSGLIEILKNLPQDAEVVIRDLNGLDWLVDRNEVFLSTDGSVVFNSEKINKF